MSCPDAESLLGLVEGRLDGPALARMEHHLDACADCRELAAHAVRARRGSAPTATEPIGAPAPPLARGTCLGRYVVIEPLGSGGMGVVYAAFDPELDRRVALKLIRPEVSVRADARTRLVREAQAMARLAHPNVVPVHDVGTHGAQVFLAMELVRGPTLRAWLAAGPRSWREIVEAFVQAGRGLAAAHDAGIVHRDFKPENVLIGDDRRARVVDFGLARPGGAADPVTPPPGDAGPITRTGAVLGTPAYMAPEQRLGRSVDARSDQYSFCVALNEALRSGRPTHVRRALQRGLSDDPARRFPSMGSLLAALQADRGHARAALLAGAGVVVLAAVGMARGHDPCAADRLAGVWDDARRRDVERAFVATGAPFAAIALRSTTDALDRYAARWSARAADACRAAAPARTTCYEERRASLGGVVAALAGADTALASKAVDVVARLPDLDRCDQPEGLRDPVPDDPALRVEVTALRARIATQHALSVNGTRAQVVPALTALLAEARGLAYRPVEAEALLGLGLVQQSHDELQQAEETFNRALDAAEEGRFDLARARSWRGLAFVYQLQRRYPEAHRAARRGEAVLRPFGAEADLVRVEIGIADGMAYWGEKNYAEALPRFERAVAVATARDGPDSLEVAIHLFNLGGLLLEMKRADAAEAAMLRALAIYRGLLGDEHLAVAKITNNLGSNAFNQRRYQDAVDYYERALAAKARLLPGDNLSIGYGLYNLAEANARLGRWSRAMPLYRRALPIVAVKLGLENEVMVGILTGIGCSVPEPALGRSALERALALGEAAKLAPRDLAMTRFALARASGERELADRARADNPESTAELAALLAKR
jgi:tetratricopeptide (TPR) repeat protein/predicted Ser/Thr protein kinase